MSILHYVCRDFQENYQMMLNFIDYDQFFEHIRLKCRLCICDGRSSPYYCITYSFDVHKTYFTRSKLSLVKKIPFMLDYVKISFECRF